jgi:hypothetical protein
MLENISDQWFFLPDGAAAWVPDRSRAGLAAPREEATAFGFLRVCVMSGLTRRAASAPGIVQ